MSTVCLRKVALICRKSVIYKMFSLKSHQNTALPRSCDVGLNPKKQVILPPFAPIFYSTSRQEYCCSNTR